MATIKLVKLISDSQGSLSDSEFVRTKVRVEKDTYTLLGTEEETTTLAYLTSALSLRMIDSKAFRTGLMQLVANAGGFANLTAIEKKIVAIHFASTGTDVASEFPLLWDRVSNGMSSFHSNGIESREQRMRWCESLIYNTVLSATATTVINRIITPVTADKGSLWSNYIRYGREGTQSGDPEGLFDYVNSVTGTTFVTNGLLEDITGGTTGEIPESEIIQRVNDCLQYGIYYKG